MDSNGWYQEQLDAHSAYQQSYAAFIGEMASRAEQTRSRPRFSRIRTVLSTAICGRPARTSPPLKDWS